MIAPCHASLIGERFGRMLRRDKYALKKKPYEECG